MAAPPSAAAPNDPRAVASLVLGIAGIACCFLAPISLLLGSSALGRIRASEGRLSGEGMAQAGRILGVVGTVILVLSVLFLAVQLVLGMRFSGFHS